MIYKLDKTAKQRALSAAVEHMAREAKANGWEHLYPTTLGLHPNTFKYLKRRTAAQLRSMRP